MIEVCSDATNKATETRAIILSICEAYDLNFGMAPYHGIHCSFARVSRYTGVHSPFFFQIGYNGRSTSPLTPDLSYTILRSSSDTRMLKIQQDKRKTRGFRTFSCFGPHIWNSLPHHLRHCSTLSSFTAKLKTFLFSQYFRPN